MGTGDTSLFPEESCGSESAACAIQVHLATPSAVLDHLVLFLSFPSSAASHSPLVGLHFLHTCLIKAVDRNSTTTMAHSIGSKE